VGPGPTPCAPRPFLRALHSPARSGRGGHPLGILLEGVSEWPWLLMGLAGASFTMEHSPTGRAVQLEVATDYCPSCIALFAVFTFPLPLTFWVFVLHDRLESICRPSGRDWDSHCCRVRRDKYPRYLCGRIR
jgi:hypothetical protein